MPCNPACELCPAYVGAKHVCVWGSGEPGGTMFIGEAPGGQEDAEGIPFVGPSGKLLRSVFPADKAYFTNAIKCFSKPLIKHARACFAYLQEEIDAVQPKQIIAVGEWASKILSEHSIEHLKIEHPSNVLQGRKSIEDWRKAERKERLPEIVPLDQRFWKVQPDQPIGVDIETCRNADRALMQIESSGKPPVPWFQPSSLNCVGFAQYQGSQRWAFHGGDDCAFIQEVLSSPNPKVFHHLLYDLVWLEHEGFRVEGDLHDTMWLLALKDESGGRGLEVGPFVYPWWIPDQCDSWEKVYSYCGNDALNTLGLFFREDLVPFHSNDFYRLYQRMARRLVAMCREGIPMFKEPWQKAIETCLRESMRYEGILQGIADINWNSDDKVAAFLTEVGALPKKYTASGKRLSVDEDALRRCKHPSGALLLQKRKVDTLLQTFLLPPKDLPRAHGILALNRASTGRTAMSRMNLQNISKEDIAIGDGTLVDKQELNLRLLFGSEEYDWVKMDLVGAELMVIAVEAQCKLLLQWFAEGRDIHKMMAGKILKKSPEEVTGEEKRRLGKVPNFTLCYGGNAGTLQQKAREEFGILLTDEEAAAIVYEWFQAFPEIALWHDQVKLQIQYRRSVTSPMGRVRTVPFLSKHDYNVALNAPIQGTVSDLLLMGLDVTHPWPGALINIVHDETDLLIPKGTWEDRREAFRRMGSGMARVHPRFPMLVEIAVGDSWGGPWREEFKVP